MLSYQNCKIFNTTNVLLRMCLLTVTVVAGFLVAVAVAIHCTNVFTTERGKLTESTHAHRGNKILAQLNISSSPLFVN